MAIQYELLAEVALSAGRLVTHEELLHRVWGPTNPGSPWVTRTRLMQMRRLLSEDAGNPAYIFAEPRVGYRMREGRRPGCDRLPATWTE